MAGIIRPMCIVLIAAILAAAISPLGEATIGYYTVVTYLTTCRPYLTNKGSLGNCCNGVKGLYRIAKTTQDRQSVCGTLKYLVGSYKGIHLNKAAGLPRQCGVNIPYKISPSTDCSKVT
ncbi:UNVERIFIED_CONTAM: Non-specific lipid-transfer protein 1 [Sesamum indicum]